MVAHPGGGLRAHPGDRDVLLGDDRRNPPEEAVPRLQADGYYRWLTYLYLPAQYAALVLCSAVWVRGELSWLGAAGLVATVGVVNGIAINTAHELGHKRETAERWLSKVALAPTGYGHFYVEHNRGHHTRVATPEDPASSRLGESFWAFWPRTVWGSLRSAWRLETSRFRPRGRSPWMHRNDVLNAWAMTLVLYAALAIVLGRAVLPFLALQAVVGFSLLEVVNYLEHYGLARQRAPPPAATRRSTPGTAGTATGPSPTSSSSSSSGTATTTPTRCAGTRPCAASTSRRDCRPATPPWSSPRWCPRCGGG
ncbi:hypothetical protein Misp05_18590 [Micromonospora sp. NBRC 107095]|nr:hypothetical protein Misp05_18590 [Micromonospora sp. NBRC 107095]